MRAYKAFKPDLICISGSNKYQYRKGIINREREANCVKNGMHCAENPLDCLSYYSWQGNVFYLVEAGGDVDEDGTDSKISCTELTLVEELSLKRFVEEAVKYIIRYPDRPYQIRSGKVRVCMETGMAECGGAVIIRGKHPGIAKEEETVLAAISDTIEHGSVIAVIKEEPDSQRIQKAHIITRGEVVWVYEGGAYRER